MPAFLDDVFANFFVESKPTKPYKFGTLLWAHAYYTHQQLDVWRPSEMDPRLGVAKNFNIETKPKDCFARSLPLTSPRCETNEEFIALRAKRRPVILIQPPDASLGAIPRGATSGKIERHLCPVALVYSAEDLAGNARYPKEFLGRVRSLEYAQFLLLPKGGPLVRDSLARLDEIQSVAENHLEHSGFSLHPDIEQILRSQMSYFFTGLSAEDFATWVEMLRDA